MITIKLPYQNNSKEFTSLLQEQSRQYSSVLRYAYNRFIEGKNEKEIRLLTKSLNNIDSIDSWIIQSAIKKANYLFKTSNNKKVIFGGKHNFLQRSKGKISKEDFKKKRTFSYTSIGEAPRKGNRKFSLNIIENNSILWKPRKGVSFSLILPKLRKNYKDYLFDLQKRTENKECPYMISLSEEFIYISFEESIKKEKIFSSEGVHAGIDLNPNYISCSIKDKESNLLKSYTFNLKGLTSKECSNNKLLHETFEISKKLSNIFIENNVNFVFIEGLKISSKNNNKGKEFNRLVNNKWQRNKFVSNLKKRCEISGISLFEVNPAYSSFIGNLIFNELPDPIAASCEIARRGYEVIIKKTKEFYPPFERCISLMKDQWKEFSLKNNVQTWKELFSLIKNSRLKYRVSWDISHVFRKFCSNKSLCLMCNRSYI